MAKERKTTWAVQRLTENDYLETIMENDTPVLVPRGTVLKIGGFPAGLIEDTWMICGTMAAAGGFEEFRRCYLDGPPADPVFDAAGLGPAGAAPADFGA